MATGRRAPPPASPTQPSRLEMWGGIECTVNRVGNVYHDQIERSGHADRDEDVQRFAALGIASIRYPVLWETVAPDGNGELHWGLPDRALHALRGLDVEPIVGLVHHGSGPAHTSLLDRHFATGLASFAATAAARYPWVERWTPVNEPLTTARFSCLYGIWYPHARDDRSFVLALLNQCRATVLAMRAIRRINPGARLIQTDDLSRTCGTPQMAEVTAFYNERRWLGWDLLCGRVDRSHTLWQYLLDNGASIGDLLWLVDNPCPPDIVGLNYYVTSERWLDHRVDAYPGRTRGGRAGHEFVDVEAVRVRAAGELRLADLLVATWQRYAIPIVITETHIDAGRQDQMRWLIDTWNAAQSARRSGADVRAVTAWSLLGSFDWNCLLSENRGYYEPGPYDLRAPKPRPTALAGLVAELAAGVAPTHAVLPGRGWWRSDGRYLGLPQTGAASRATCSDGTKELARPILISGASGTLGRAFARICGQRHIAYRLVGRAEMDIAEAADVAAAIARWKPWAIVNASGYVRIDEAESDGARCHRENALGPQILARCCLSEGVRLITFSSDQVFDGRANRPWVESDAPAPLNAYGSSKFEAERTVLAAFPQAMVVRTSAFFGPWDSHNFVAQALRAAERGEPFFATADERVSPTYVPDLVNVCLDLLIDGEHGLWHLANVGDVSWLELAAEALKRDGANGSLLRRRTPRLAAPRPAYGVLASERAFLMPTLEDALNRFMAARRESGPIRIAANQSTIHPLRRPGAAAAVPRPELATRAPLPPALSLRDA